MRTHLFVLIAAAFVIGALPAIGQQPGKLPFKVEFDPDAGVTKEDQTGKEGLYFTVRFNIVRQGNAANEPGKDYKVIVLEDGREVARCDVPEPKLSDELSAVLAIDISGSMAKDIQGNKENKKRIDQARIAAESFVKRLPARADCGLILFDHEIQPSEKVALAGRPQTSFGYHQGHAAARRHGLSRRRPDRHQDAGRLEKQGAIPREGSRHHD